MAVYLLATLDTKGAEAAFVRDRLAELGVAVEVIDTSCGTQTGDRGAAVAASAERATRLVVEAFAAGKVDGVLSLGGSAGTTIGTAAMRALPIGVPKLMVSTLASGQVRSWVGDKDILMLNSVVDIAGINRISRLVLNQAAAAMAGMVRCRERPPWRSFDKPDRPLIAATMFGVTTPCVQHARKILEDAGYEVLVFHATGNGGQAMESLIREGLIAGVLDITTTELADELVGGILSAGPDRLTAAARMGIPQVISVGALDMVNFGPRDSVPARFNNRQFHVHNASVTLMRTTPEENAKLGEEIGRKLASAKGPSAILLPLQGVSAIDKAGQPFDDPAARTALFAAIRQHHGSTELIEVDCHINDSEFAEAAAMTLLDMIPFAAGVGSRVGDEDQRMGERVQVIDREDAAHRRMQAGIGCSTISAAMIWPLAGSFYTLFRLIVGSYPDFPFIRIVFGCWMFLGFMTVLDILRVRYGDKFNWSAIGLGLVVQFTLLLPHIVTGAVLDAMISRAYFGGYVFLASLGMAVFCGVWTYYAARYVYQHWCVPSEVVKS